MTIREIIQDLRARGMTIEYRNRSDGGVIITSINGVKYQAAQGNTVARNLAGVALSSKQASQLKEIKPQLGVKITERKKEKLDAELVKEVRKAQRIWNKYNPDVEKGRIKLSHVRYVLKTQGRQAAIESLAKATLYAKGIAYDKNVEWLEQKIKMAAQASNYDVSELIRDMEKLKNEFKFRDEWISGIYEVWYKVNEGFPIQEAISMTYQIMGE